MANAKRKRNRQTVDDEFNIDLLVAVGQLLPARHIAPGDVWSFYVDGTDLIIVRTRSVATNPDPDS